MGKDSPYLEKSSAVSRYNKRLTNAFMAVAGIGFAITLPAEGMRWAKEMAQYDLLNSTMLDVIHSDAAKFYAGHVKGMGQAIYYGQILNGVIGSVQSDRGFKQRDLDKAKISDVSFKASALILTMGFVWEKYTQIASNRAFDTNDMMLYVAGAAVLIGCNKLAEQICLKLDRAEPKQAEAERISYIGSPLPPKL